MGWSGLDLEYRYLSLADEQLAGRAVHILNGDLYHLPFVDNSFDKVILAEVLEHLVDERAGLAEVVRVTGMGEFVRKGDARALAIVRVLRHKEAYVKPRGEIDGIFSLERTVEEHERFFQESIKPLSPRG